MTPKVGTLVLFPSYMWHGTVPFAAGTPRLLEATVDCLVEHGWSGTSTTLVSARAGVSRGAQLHHFPTKNDLVLAADALDLVADDRIVVGVVAAVALAALAIGYVLLREVLAAGQGTRMRSAVPKVLHPVCGRALVAWPIARGLATGAMRSRRKSLIRRAACRSSCSCSSTTSTSRARRRSTGWWSRTGR